MRGLHNIRGHEGISSEAPRAAITLAALLHLGQPVTRELAAFHRAA